VLSDDPLTVAEDAIANITASMTMVGGALVHEAPPWHA
jgi:predicted amidohydrolase YtcJ